MIRSAADTLGDVVHEVAELGFGKEAVVYERSRPSYPPDAVAWLVDRL
ncbi:MAG TPA: hypothetical protein VGV86_15640 [Acidimicrobiales bacterium]|nr:hypothetical protein [Acidimicrobiales bacterium]